MTNITKKPTCLILGGGANGLGCARSLSMAKICSEIVITTKNDVARHTNASIKKHKFYDLPDLENALFTFLMEHNEEKKVLLPTSDVMLKFIAKYRSELETKHFISAPKNEIIDLLVDKKKKHDLLTRLGYRYQKQYKI